MTVDDLALLPASELGALYQSKQASPVEATRAVLDRIERFNERVNAYNLVDPEQALEQARRSEERYRIGQPLGVVDGVTVAVKDVFETRGWPTLRGSTLADPNVPSDADAPTVAALRRHGAVFVGKTTTPELGWKGVTDSPLTGITRNPWNLELTPGGSSGGSGAALPLGMCHLALGTDGGGSIRIPAGFTGTVGLKPTYGVVPHWPASPYGRLAHAGPMTRTVADCALMLGVLAEPDLRDPAALPPPPPGEFDLDRHGVRGLRIALSPTLGYATVDEEVRASVLAAAHTLEGLGAQVEEVDPGFADPLHTYEVLWNSGAARVAVAYSDDQLGQLDRGLLGIIEGGRQYSAVDYLNADIERSALGMLMNAFHQQYDLLLTPTLPIPAFEAGHDVPAGWHDERWPTWTPFSYPFNITQQPAISVPCGFTEAGLPVGLQIVGPKHRDGLVLRAAYAYQAANPLTDRLPPLT